MFLLEKDVDNGLADVYAISYNIGELTIKERHDRSGFFIVKIYRGYDFLGRTDTTFGRSRFKVYLHEDGYYHHWWESLSDGIKFALSFDSEEEAKQWYETSMKASQAATAQLRREILKDQYTCSQAASKALSSETKHGLIVSSLADKKAVLVT